MISIIIPVYNVKEYLRECIESIKRQTLQDIEIILVDDGSTDGSSKICDEYASHEHQIVVIHKENGGLVNARKTGIRAASGEYIAFVDGDDWIEPVMLEYMCKKMTEQDVDVVMCGRYEDTGDGHREVYHGIPEARYDRQQMYTAVYPRMIVNEEFFEWGIFPGLWDKLFRRECIEEYQLKVDERIVMGEDAACVYPCLLNVSSIYIMHECLYHYRQTETSMVKQSGQNQIERQRFKILYEYVKNELFQYKHIYDLREQWDKYVLFLMVARADGLYSGYEDLEYLFPYSNVKKGENIVLYGAGTYGQRLYQYLKRTNFCNVIAWTDRNYKELRKMGLTVDAPEDIDKCQYDHIVITITYAKARKALYQELVRKYNKTKIALIDEKVIFSSKAKRAFGLIE